MFTVETASGRFLRFSYPAYTEVTDVARATRFSTRDRAESFLRVWGGDGFVVSAWSV